MTDPGAGHKREAWRKTSLADFLWSPDDAEFVEVIVYLIASFCFCSFVSWLLSFPATDKVYFSCASAKAVARNDTLR